MTILRLTAIMTLLAWSGHAAAAPPVPPAGVAVTGAAPATAPLGTTVTPAEPAVSVKVIPATSPAPVKRAEVICRTTIETGSLIAKHKTCLTHKQWDYVNETNRAQAERLFDDQRTKSSSN